MHRDTARLTIRPMTHDDAHLVVELLNDEAFLLYIGDKGVRTLDDARRYIDEGPLASYQKFGFGLDVVCIRSGGAPIGICGLLKRDALPEPDIGFAYLAPYRGAGYGYEAADSCLAHARRVLGLRGVLAITSPENTASVRLLEKLGFRFERLHSMGEGKSEVNLFRRSLAE